MLLNRSSSLPLAGRRVLITGGARGIGAATAIRMRERGAHVALLGLEPDQLAVTAAKSGDAFWREVDVTDRDAVQAGVDEAAEALGGLDVVMANAGTAAQLAIVGGNADVWDKTIAVNLHGVFNTLRAAGPHIAHERGYALAIASLAAAVHAPLLGAYSASKAAVEALGNTLRTELHSTGARVGVGYFAEFDTDMTSRGFGTEAAARLQRGLPQRVAPLHIAIDAIERGIERRSRRVFAPAWVGLALPARMLIQPVVDRATRANVAAALEIARTEEVELTTPQRSSEKSTA
jgi:NAD(P)-dependent dehydrogenase (short-subunit alcohol dehydrogenase family)